jgi:hypothetical protein
MSAMLTQAKAVTLRARLLTSLRRLLLIVALGFTIGWILNRAATALDKGDRPAGFVHGLVQGALMPMSMPNLAFGIDVPIYAAKNTGRSYKLGYTTGVNGCGLIFFGVFFWRLRHLKTRVVQFKATAFPIEKL